MSQHFKKSGFVITLLLVLTAFDAPAQTVVRGPYLQQMSDTFITVRWRTDVPTDAVVRYGVSSGNLDQSAGSATVGVDHEITLVGLSAHTDYYYTVGNAANPLAGDAGNVFTTAPAPDQNELTEIWVVGDSGTANSNAINVRDAFYQYTNNQLADMILMLGDNAYPSGTDEQYQTAMFDMYPNLLRKMPVWSTFGNHDGVSADSATQSGPYYDMFTLPDNAQLGGVASGTEAYYSFERDNIHFVVLNSFDIDRSPQSAMMTWLENDLAGNTKDWLVAMWHHPPYSRGSHNSDLESELIDMRTNALPILEAHGVDLVLAGHSHAYERSYLLDSHYGSSDTIGPQHFLNFGDGRKAGDGAYAKPNAVGASNQGAVYAVAGSSGTLGGGLLDHPAMFISLNSLGSMILNIEGLRMDAVFINSTAQVEDAFTILKGDGLDNTPPFLYDANPFGSTEVILIFSEPLDMATAEDLGNYSIDLGVTILAATASNLNDTVTLTTTPLVQGLTYTLTVNGVSDTHNNFIALNTQAAVIFTNNSIRSFIQGQAPTTDYMGMSDTYLSSSTPDMNYGDELAFFLDGDDPAGTGHDLVTLLKWDLSSLPANTTVFSVSISLEVFDPGTNPYQIYSLLKPWDENSVTWNNSATGISWEVAGAQGAGDRGTQVLGTVTVPAIATQNIVLNADAVALVQSWVDGSTKNHGLIIGNAQSGDGADIRSSEYSIWQSRPRLWVGISMPLNVDTDNDGQIDTDDNCPLHANSNQTDTDGDGYGNRCDADFNNDCVVNFGDFPGMTNNFLGSEALYDLNEDGLVNFGDVALFSSLFLQEPGPSAFGDCP